MDCASYSAQAYAPVAQPVSILHSDSNVNGGTSLASLFTSLGSVGVNVYKAVVTPGVSTTAPRLQLNPATGTYQYFNPVTGTYSPSNPASFLGGGGSSLLLIIAAVVVAFFAFGGRKALAT